MVPLPQPSAPPHRKQQSAASSPPPQVGTGRTRTRPSDRASSAGFALSPEEVTFPRWKSALSHEPRESELLSQARPGAKSAVGQGLTWGCLHTQPHVQEM